jgi:acyl-CoA dehydrogenase
MKTEITIARVFLNDCIEKHLNGALDVTTAAMAKYWLTELEGRVLDTCLQLFGGYGYMWEFPIARAMRTPACTASSAARTKSCGS